MLEIKKILVPSDFSPCSGQALAHALALARRIDAEVHVLFAEVPYGEAYPKPADSAAADPLQAFLEQAGVEQGDAALDPACFRIEHVVVRNVIVAPAILDYAVDQDIDLIVMGTHGRRSVEHLLLGSIAEDIVRLAPCPVLTLRASKKPQPAPTEVRSILVPVDFSEHAREALRYARVLAAFFDARLDLLHVIEEALHPAFYGPGLQSVYDVIPDLDEKAEERLRTFYWEAEGGAVSEVRFKALTGKVARVIAKYAAQEGTDLIVIATHGLTGLEHYFMGSVAERVVRRAPCPVFTVKSYGKSLLHRMGEAVAEVV